MASMAVVSLGIAASLLTVARMHARAEASVWDGIYTEEQAKAGQAVYVKECASCHRDQLQGHGTNPPLTGSGFVEKWDGQALGDLFEKIQTSMPADHPGRLSRDENASVLAYILQFDGFPAGEQKLQTDSDWLAGIRFKAAKPN